MSQAASELIDALDSASPELIRCFKEALTRQFEKVRKETNFTDEKFENVALVEMFADADSLYSLSAEHQKTLLIMFEMSKSEWDQASLESKGNVT